MNNNELPSYFQLWFKGTSLLPAQTRGTGTLLNQTRILIGNQKDLPRMDQVDSPDLAPIQLSHNALLGRLGVVGRLGGYEGQSNPNR